jgi:predicted unusual protein kinase regulating ubiquinone biosynthesis (AarF/ABC1/UbiB family)
VVLIDFGMVVEMPARFHEALREFVIGLGTRDASRVLKSYSMVGVVRPGADMAQMEEMIGEQLEVFWGSFLGQVRPGDLANPAARAFFDKYQGLMRLAPFQFQTEMLFMMRSMSLLSGLTARLDPEFDAWEQTSPFALKLWQDDFLQKFASMVRNSARDIASGRFPVGLVSVLRMLSARNQPPPAAVSSTSMTHEVVLLRRSINKLTRAIVVAGALVAGAVVLTNNIHLGASVAQLWPSDHLGQWLTGLSFAGLALVGWRLS